MCERRSEIGDFFRLSDLLSLDDRYAKPSAPLVRGDERAVTGDKIQKGWKNNGKVRLSL